MHLLRYVRRGDGRTLPQLRRRTPAAPETRKEMNYRHAYHAGNFADVVKHLALVAALRHLKKKEASFAVIDTHAGRGLYDLESDETGKTGEAEAGILRLARLRDPPLLVSEYLILARPEGARQYQIFAYKQRRISQSCETQNACFRLAGLAGLVAFEIVKPTPRMGIDHGEGRFLLFQVPQRRDQRQMLHHIGEVPGVIGVAIIHFLTRFGRGWSSPPQLGQRPSIASPHVAQKVHS